MLKGQKIIPTPEDLYLEVPEYMLPGDYREALPLLLNLWERGYKGANISYTTGECYLKLMGNQLKALPFLKDALQKISDSCTGDLLTEEMAPAKAPLYLGIRILESGDSKSIFGTGAAVY